MLNEEKTKFQEENDELLKFILNKRFFKIWEETPPLLGETSQSMAAETELELYITNRCNQACKYCYLYNNHELYPEEFNNEETILKNLELIFKWALKNNYKFEKIDLYSGEIWHTPFGLKVLEKCYNALIQGLQVRRFMIASNGTFVRKDETLQPIQEYIYKMATYGAVLQISFSIDGKIIEEINRPLKNGKRTNEEDDFYDRVFSFVKHNGYGFHPMVAAESIEKWKENWMWWRKQCDKFNIICPHEAIMLLEVRNPDVWTHEKIEAYCDFLEFLVEDFFKLVAKKSSEYFSKFIIGDIDVGQSYAYLPWVLTHSGTAVGCTASTSCTIRVGDLAICPCHRTSYKKNIYGYFIVDNDEIVGIKENNFYLANRILLANNQLCSLKCDTCSYNLFCIHGCFGAQLEANNDMFLPIESVCALEKRKIQTCVKIYEKYGVFDYLETLGIDDAQYPRAQELLELRKMVNEDVRIQEVEREAREILGKNACKDQQIDGRI